MKSLTLRSHDCFRTSSKDPPIFHESALEWHFMRRQNNAQKARSHQWWTQVHCTSQPTGSHLKLTFWHLDPSPEPHCANNAERRQSLAPEYAIKLPHKQPPGGR